MGTGGEGRSLFSEYMLEVYWNLNSGWSKPRIVPVHNFDLPPFNSGLNHGLAGIEGMKAYCDPNTKVIRTFRPDKYAERLNKTSEELGFPTFDPSEFVKCLDELLKVESKNLKLTTYIRPIVFSLTNQLHLRPPEDSVLLVALSPAYSKAEGSPITLKAERNGYNSWSNGVRCFRPGAASTISLKYNKAASDSGFDQILWVYGKKITETDNSNIFIHFINDDNEEVLITPTIDGSVLPGIYREIILDFARERNGLIVAERDIDIMELHNFSQRNKVNI